MYLQTRGTSRYPQQVARRVSVAGAKVASAFLAHPADELWGHQIAEWTGLAAGTLYPLLHRFEAAGFLKSRLESPTEPDPTAPRRPPRRYYRLTPDGHAEFSVLLESLKEAL